MGSISILSFEIIIKSTLW